MDNKLTDKIKKWLDTEPEKRDYILGAELMLKLNRNRFLYQNAIRHPERFAEKIEYELKKFLDLRLNSVTFAEIEELEKVVEKEVLPVIDKMVVEDETGKIQFIGKRPDHDKLPDEIQAIYVEQATIAHQMRDLHAKLRLKSTADYQPCDRYQELDLLVSLNKTYLANWEKYDHYQIDAKKVATPKTKATKTKSNKSKKSK